MGGLALLFQASLVAALLSLNPAAPAPSPNFRGVAVQDEAYFKADTIRCKDGSKSFSSDQLNDDFCDCSDGTDEPGTSACPSGKFHCRNKGHTPMEIYSSRVNDGICDCCDGSDEYDGKAKCSNTCSQAGKVMREKLERKIATFKGGVEVRKQDIEHARHMISKEKVELSTLKQEEKQLKEQVQKLKAKKEEIEKAEQQEKLKREKEEKARKEAERKDAKEEAIEEKKTDLAEEDPILEDPTRGLKEEKMVLDDDENIVSSEHNQEGLSKEELGRLVASRWTGENPNIEKEGTESVANDHDAESEDMYDDDADHEHEDEDEASTENEDDEEDEKDVVDDQDEPEEASSSEGEVLSKEGPWWTKLKDKIKEFSESIFVKTPVDKSEADRIRIEYKDSTSKLSEIQSKISDLEKKLEQDFGKDGEFYSLYGQCFELRLQKYTYKVCPFRHGVQVEGHSTTTLGNWDGFKDEYKSMHFVRGDRCWNGPDRSLKVKLRCGSKIELRDVDEPSRCEYVAELSTPAVCLQERLAALEQRLHDQGNVGHHDEL